MRILFKLFYGLVNFIDAIKNIGSKDDSSMTGWEDHEISRYNYLQKRMK